MTGAASPFGGAFFDSFLDRYAEAAVYGGLVVHYAGGVGTISGVEAAFAAAIGSLMVSYARARAEGGLGIECRAGLFARPERIAVIIIGLVTGLVLPALVLLAVATNITAARRLLAVRGGVTLVMYDAKTVRRKGLLSLPPRFRVLLPVALEQDRHQVLDGHVRAVRDVELAERADRHHHVRAGRLHALVAFRPPEAFASSGTPPDRTPPPAPQHWRASRRTPGQPRGGAPAAAR